MRTRIFTLMVNCIFIWAPKICEKSGYSLDMDLFTVSHPKEKWLVKRRSNHLRPIYLKTSWFWAHLDFQMETPIEFSVSPVSWCSGQSRRRVRSGRIEPTNSGGSWYFNFVTCLNSFCRPHHHQYIGICIDIWHQYIRQKIQNIMRICFCIGHLKI